ncbi:MAG: hypothetical protein M1812_005426 [Candelaria pacifica]|nr:MAG: hypothetical protein M1812_005426 [Candelaria pacifica]
MSAPQPPTTTPPSTSPETYQTLKYNVSLSLCLACPILIILPPRKLDFYTFSLSTAFVFSLNEQSVQRTRKSLVQHLDRRRPGLFKELPTEEARDLKDRLRRERLVRAQPGGQGFEDVDKRGGGSDGVGREGVGVLDKVKEREEERKKGVVQKIWMGSEEEGWKERRLREEQEALDEGRGYGGLIIDQIWEVWNWGRKSDDDDDGDGDAGKR